MRIQHLLIESHLEKSRAMLKESCDGLDLEQRRIVEGIYNEMLPLIEASLSADQIKQLFGEVEKTATAAGGNRTLIGKGKDVADKANEIIDNIGKWLQDTTPVKAFDQKFEQLKAKVGAKFPDLDKKLTAMGSWAKENPGKTAAIVGVLTAIASLAGGPLGGAIAGQVLRGAVELLKGEKLSTAIGKGIKTAALGYLSGKAFEMLGDFAAGIRIKSLPFGPETAGFEEITFGAAKTRWGPGWEWTEQLEGVDIIVDPEMASAVKSAQNLLRMGGDAALEGFDQLKGVADVINSQDYKDMIVNTLEISRQELLKNDSLLQFINTAKQGLQAASQGAVAAAGVAGSGKAAPAGAAPAKESRNNKKRPLSEGQVYLIFNRISQQQLNEGPMDAIKGAAGKAMDWAKTKGTNLTTKVTADKLNSAWQKAGAPTDSDELAKFLEKQGVSADIVKQVYGSLKISSAGAEPAAPVVDIEAVKKIIATLPTDRKVRLLKSLEKGGTSKPAAPTTTTAAPEKDSLGRIEPTMS